jgi:hypothetical protein
MYNIIFISQKLKLYLKICPRVGRLSWVALGVVGNDDNNACVAPSCLGTDLVVITHAVKWLMPIISCGR